MDNTDKPSITSLSLCACGEAQGQLSPSQTPMSSQKQSTWYGFDPQIRSSLLPAWASCPHSPAAL